MQKEGSCEKLFGSSMIYYSRKDTAVRLDGGAPCDLSSHLRSVRVYLRLQLLGLARFMQVASVGSGSPSVKDSA